MDERESRAKPKKTAIRSFLGRIHRSKSRGADPDRNKENGGSTIPVSQSDGDIKCRKSRDENLQKDTMSPTRRFFERLSYRSKGRNRSSTSGCAETAKSTSSTVKATSHHDLPKAVNDITSTPNRLQQQVVCGTGAISEMDLRFVTTRDDHFAIPVEENYGFGEKSPRAFLSESDLSSGIIECEEVRRTPSYLRISCALNGYTRSPKNDLESSHAKMGESLVERRLRLFQQPNGRSKQMASEFDSPVVSSCSASSQTKTSQMEAYTPIAKPSGSRLHVLQQSEMGNNVSTPAAIKDLISKFDQLDICSTNKAGKEKEGVENIEPHRLVINEQPDFDDELTKDPNGNEPCVKGDEKNEEEDEEAVEEKSTLAAPLKISMDIESDSGISGGSINYSPDVEKKSEEKSPQNGEEFREVHDRVKQKLQTKMEEANKDLENVEAIPEKCADSLRAAHGNAHLLVRKKFSKFNELIEKNINPIADDPMPVNFCDLEAFWQTIEMELDGIWKEFEKVEKFRSSNWDENAVVEEEVATENVIKPKPVIIKKKSPVLSAEAKEKLDKQRAAAEQRRLEMRAQMRQKMMKMKNETKPEETTES